VKSEETRGFVIDYQLGSEKDSVYHHETTAGEVVVIALFRGLFSNIKDVGTGRSIAVNKEVDTEGYQNSENIFVRTVWRQVPLEGYSYCKGWLFSTSALLG